MEQRRWLFLTGGLMFLGLFLAACSILKPSPTATPVPPTDTPVLPTVTPTPPTGIPVPPTNTPLPPTATPTPNPTTATPTTGPFATIQGQVYLTGSNLPVVTTVLLTNSSTRQELSATTGTDGHFVFPYLSPGSYDLFVWVNSSDPAYSLCSTIELPAGWLQRAKVRQGLMLEGALSPLMIVAAGQTVQMDCPLTCP